jgi:hypothetical protein
VNGNDAHAITSRPESTPTAARLGGFLFSESALGSTARSAKRRLGRRERPCAVDDAPGHRLYDNEARRSSAYLTSKQTSKTFVSKTFFNSKTGSFFIKK